MLPVSGFQRRGAGEERLGSAQHGSAQLRSARLSTALLSSARLGSVTSCRSRLWHRGAEERVNSSD